MKEHNLPLKNNLFLHIKLMDEAKTGTSVSIVDFPNEILLQIFSYLDTFTLASTIQFVCKSWNEISEDPSLWKSISFRGNRNVCHIPKVLAKYPSLQSLNIERGILNSSVFSAISLLGYLESLSLQECTFFIGSKTAFCALMNSSTCLTFMEMRKCCVDSKILDVISELKSLKHLNITYLENQSLIRILQNCNKLEHLEIDKIDHLSEETIEYIFRLRSDTIASLVLNGERRLSDAAFARIENCLNLSKLSISRCVDLTDHFLFRLHKLPSIKFLNLTFGSSFTAVGLKELFKGHYVIQLTHLDLTRCANFDDVCLAIMANKCRELKSLCLKNCLKLTDQSVCQVVLKCPKLRTLDLSWIEQLRGLFLPDLKDHLKELKILDLRMCHGIEKIRIKTLLVSRPSLKIYT